MKLPCEQALWYVLPAIRADLARELVSRGLSQKDAAEKLGVTSSAVSQYLSKKRGSNQNLGPDYQQNIKTTADHILNQNDEIAVNTLICKCCKTNQQK